MFSRDLSLEIIPLAKSGNLLRWSLFSQYQVWFLYRTPKNNWKRKKKWKRILRCFVVYSIVCVYLYKIIRLLVDRIRLLYLIPAQHPMFINSSFRANLFYLFFFILLAGKARSPSHGDGNWEKFRKFHSCDSNLGQISWQQPVETRCSGGSKTGITTISQLRKANLALSFGANSKNWIVRNSRHFMNSSLCPKIWPLLWRRFKVWGQIQELQKNRYWNWLSVLLVLGTIHFSVIPSFLTVDNVDHSEPSNFKRFFQLFFHHSERISEIWFWAQAISISQKQPRNELNSTTSSEC